MLRSHFALFASVLAASLCLGGCDLLADDPEPMTGTITGTVVLAETGEPIRGLGVALKQGGGGPAYSLQAVAQTDADGVFRIDYDAEGDRSGLSVTINAEPHDTRYTADGGKLRPGEGTVVSAKTGDPIAGLTVALDEIVGISHAYVETVRTDGEGRFSLAYEATESFGYNVVINANNTTLNLTGRTFRVNPGDDRDLGVIELSRIED